jgi:hypothetical protein
MNDISMNDISMNDISMNDISMNDISMNDNNIKNNSDSDCLSIISLSDSLSIISSSDSSDINTFFPFNNNNDITTNIADISINKIELGMTLEDDYSNEYRKLEKKFDSRRICKLLNTNKSISMEQDNLGLSIEDIVNSFLENYTELEENETT